VAQYYALGDPRAASPRAAPVVRETSSVIQSRSIMWKRLHRFLNRSSYFF